VSVGPFAARATLRATRGPHRGLPSRQAPMNPFDLLASVIKISLLINLFLAAIQGSVGTARLLIWLGF